MFQIAIMKTLLLRFIHHLITLGEFVKCMFLFIPFLDGFNFNFSKKSSTLSIQADSKSLKKIPNHLGLIIAEDDFSFRDIANIVVWSVTMGISWISIYDVNGEIKRNSKFLQENLEVASEEVMGANKSNYDIQLFSSTQAYKHASKAPKGRQARVCLLCMEDGQKGIVGVAKKVGQMVSSGTYRLDDIVPSNIDAFITESLNVPDPELCLKFGATHSLLGYLPWHVRLTEFMFLPNHHGFTYKSFLSSLSSFANTAQRFGK